MLGEPPVLSSDSAERPWDPTETALVMVKGDDGLRLRGPGCAQGLSKAIEMVDFGFGPGRTALQWDRLLGLAVSASRRS